jgi:bacterioferritin-associated ferredoxin
MYLCICNAITEKMLEDDPNLIDKIGTKCGTCLLKNNDNEDCDEQS